MAIFERGLVSRGLLTHGLIEVPPVAPVSTPLLLDTGLDIQTELIGEI